MKWTISASAPAARAASVAVPHRVLVERGHHRTGRVDPLRHLEAALARHDRREVAGHAPGVGPGAPAELQRVAKAPRGDEGAAHALALQHGVGADGGAVDHRLEPARPRAERGEAGHEAVRLVGRRGRHLATRMAPEAGSTSSRSVKVPPTSTPSRQRLDASFMRRCPPPRRAPAGPGPPARRASAPAPCAAGGRRPRRS